MSGPAAPPQALAVWQRCRRALRLWRAALRRRKHARALHATWDRLDARTLRDLGVDRSECLSYAREAADGADATRRRLAA